MIRTNKLTKQFSSAKNGTGFVGVDRLDLEVDAGQVFGFLGPNGAGKTTTVRMLTALIAPTSGEAWVNDLKIGRDDMAIRRSVGILTESPGLYDRLSAEKNLQIYARLYEVDNVAAQVEKYLRMLGLWERRADMAGTFSKGMKQKLAICRSLLHEPPIIFLDEPTSGLDPEAAKLVHDFIAELKGEGRTIFLCTHNLDEADRLCDRVGLMKQRLLVVDSPQNLRQRLFGRKIVFQVDRVTPTLLQQVRQLGFVRSVDCMKNGSGDQLIVALDKPEEQNPVIVRELVSAGAAVRFVGEQSHSLEEIYFSLINNRAMVAGEA